MLCLTGESGNLIGKWKQVAVLIMVIIQNRGVDLDPAEAENTTADFSMHRRRLRSRGLANLISLVAEAMVPSLKPASPVPGCYGAKFAVCDTSVTSLGVKRNASRFTCIRNENTVMGVSREFLGAYQMMQTQTAMGSYARIDSLEAGWEYRVELTDYDIIVPALPREMDGARIVQLSDLHIGRFVKPDDIRQVAAFVSALRPDLIVMTGDHVFQPESAGEFQQALGHIRALSPALGIYATMGNHDYWDGASMVRGVLRASDITLLSNENREVVPGIWLAGIDDLLAGQPDLVETLRGIPQDAVTVLLSHNPNILPQAAGHALVILSGHTHGAQLKFAWQDFASTTHPDLYAHLATAFETVGYAKRGGNLDGLGCWRYMEGWYEAGKARMYVSRGLGMVRPPYRVNCPAEIATFQLKQRSG